MTMYEELIKRLKNCTSDTVEDCAGCPYQGGYKGTYCMNGLIADAADAIENLDDICQHQADEIRELQKKLCEWCGVCSEGRRRPSDCEIIYPNRQPKDGEE